jgi:Tfp pilus assembly protein PilX
MVVRTGKEQATANRSNGIDGGIALILVMLAMIVLSLLAAAIVFTARADILASYNYKLSTQADYLAKAGVQEALNWFRSARYRAVSQAQAPTYYHVTATGSIYNLYSSASSPVKCISSSPGCPSPNNAVHLIGIPETGSTNYPSITNVGGTAVATAFASDLVNARLTGDASNSGTFSINAVLLNYQTLNSGADCGRNLADHLPRHLDRGFRLLGCGGHGGRTGHRPASLFSILRPRALRLLLGNDAGKRRSLYGRLQFSPRSLWRRQCHRGVGTM